MTFAMTVVYSLLAAAIISYCCSFLKLSEDMKFSLKLLSFCLAISLILLAPTS